ncbi:MAG: response regulator [Bryobacterales bacterium]|nr:response regulator [Bryobacterales bacterium]
MSHQGGRILLVEDSPTQAERIRKLLVQDGHQVIQVPNAEQALRQLERDRPDVIVLDNHLPGMTGNDFCREIRLNVNTRAIPVLMLTSENSDVAHMQGLASGADDYVVKSVDPDILRVRVRALLRKSEGERAVPDVESRFRQASVLVIDDSATYLYIARKELEMERYHVETAEGPEEGLRLLRTQPFDCVLVDFSMPVLDGAQVCRQIRDTNADIEPEIVLIMLSSHEDKWHMTQAFDAGADDYISKSTEFSVTKSRIRALLRRKFLVEENRRISEEIRQKELATMRANAEREAAELRAQMADQLAKANRELDRANKELELFAYAAAHDLKEPLRKVRIFSELLARRYGGQLDAQGHEFIRQCVDGTGRMNQLIDDLLAYAQASQAQQGDLVAVPVAGVIEQVLASLQPLVEESGATVSFANLPSVVAEQVRLHQLFHNLIANALKYRRPDVPPRVEIQGVAAHGEWLFSVRDNGMGIASRDQDKIFRAFQRLHSAENPGTGLGLAICKRIVESFGGRLWVESTVGQGSAFWFTLPMEGRRAALAHG